MIYLNLYRQEKELLSIEYIPNDAWCGISFAGGEYQSLNLTDLLVWAKAVVASLDHD